MFDLTEHTSKQFINSAYMVEELRGIIILLFHHCESITKHHNHVDLGINASKLVIRTK